MTLKNAALLALIGMILATLVLGVGFIGDASRLMDGLIPSTKVLSSFVYAFAALSAAVFLYFFHKAQ